MNHAEFVQKAITGLREAKMLGVDGPNTPTNWVFSCPFKENHGGRTKQQTPPFGINKITGAWHCYSCGVGGTSIHFLWARLFGVSLEEAQLLLGVPFLETDDLRKRLHSGNNTGKWPQCVEHLPHTIPLDQAPEAIEFLWDKYRIPLELAVRAGIRYCPDARIPLLARDADGKQRSIRGERLVYPITFAGQSVGWSSRALHPQGDEPKYFRPITNIGTVFYDPQGLFEKHPPKLVFLVEGEMDAIAGWRETLPMVATEKAGLTNEQAARLSGVAKTAFLFDNDDAGRKGVANAIKEHGAFLSYQVAWIRSLNRNGQVAKDPGEAVEGFGSDVLAQITLLPLAAGSLRDRLRGKA